MQNAETYSVAETRESAEPITLLKRIGSTNFIVTVHFSGKENMENKVLRMIEREVSAIA